MVSILNRIGIENTRFVVMFKKSYIITKVNGWLILRDQEVRRLPKKKWTYINRNVRAGVSILNRIGIENAWFMVMFK